jgi:hypothetical protein
MTSALPYRRGRHVVICGVSGKACYDDEVVRRYDGLIVARENNDPQHPQELIRTRPERPPQPPLNPDPPPLYVAVKQYGYDYGGHWNFAPNLPDDLITNYTYDSAANDPVSGTADSFFTRTGDAKWYRNGDGILVLGSANGMVREFDINGNFFGWLLELVSKQNICLQSNDLTTTWSAVRGSAVANQTTFADRTLTMDKFVEDTTVNADHRINQAITILNATAYCAGIFAKPAERSRFDLVIKRGATFIGANFNLATGVISSPQTGGISDGSAVAVMERYIDGIFRCSIPFTSDSTAGEIRCYMSNGSTVQYNGDGVSGMYFGGGQMEAGPCPTSYIPTTTVPVTRAADRAYLTPGSWFSKSAGTIYATCRLGVGNKGANQFLVDFTDNSFVNTLTLFSSASGLGSMAVNKASGAAGLASMAPPALPDRTNFRLIGAYSENYVRVALNGVLGGRDTVAPMITANLTRMDVGCDQGGTSNCHALWLQTLDYWPEAFTEAQMLARSLNP